MNARLGCQARPWLQTWGRDAFAERLGEAMSDIATIGFSGFETALAVLPEPARFAELSRAAGGLALSGAHAGGPWWDDAAGEAITKLAADAKVLPELGCERLVVSLPPPPDPLTGAHLGRLTDHLTRLSAECGAAGVRVAVHNHAAELADDARVLTAIVDTCPDVVLGADLGWVAHAGVDVVAFIERFGARLDYLHVRDVIDSGFIEVGRGTLDFPGILRALDAVGYTGWLVAESEFTDAWRGDTDPGTTAAAQYAGLARLTAAKPDPDY